MQSFTAKQATALTGCTGHQLRYWDEIGLVRPSIQSTGGTPAGVGSTGFPDLILLRSIRTLITDMSLQRVRRSIEYVRKQGYDPAVMALRAAGSTIVFRLAENQGQIIDALREGQIAFFGAAHQAATEVPDASIVPFRDRDEFLEAAWTARKDLLVGATG